MASKKMTWRRRGGMSTQIVAYFDDGSERGVVAQVGRDGGTFTKEEAIAHQKLVAAAPDLIAAAKEIMKQHPEDCGCPMCDGESGNGNGIPMLRSAIANAEAR